MRLPLFFWSIVPYLAKRGRCFCKCKITHHFFELCAFCFSKVDKRLLFVTLDRMDIFFCTMWMFAMVHCKKILHAHCKAELFPRIGPGCSYGWRIRFGFFMHNLGEEEARALLSTAFRLLRPTAYNDFSSMRILVAGEHGRRRGISLSLLLNAVPPVGCLRGEIRVGEQLDPGLTNATQQWARVNGGERCVEKKRLVTTERRS